MTAFGLRKGLRRIVVHSQKSNIRQVRLGHIVYWSPLLGVDVKVNT